jgi:hypothetical protein
VPTLNCSFAPKVSLFGTSDMQPTLFGPLEPPDRELEAGQSKPPRAPRRQNESDEPVATLFGFVETKAQARKRAQRLVRLIGIIEDAPETLACYENDIRTLEYFIERGTIGTLTPNDRDGLLRFVGDLEELLTEDECREMQDDPDIWKALPTGWLGTRLGDLYASALHPKEIAYLRQLQEERRDEMIAVLTSAAEARDELPELKSIGPLPDDIAIRYCITPMGDRLQTAPVSKSPA